MTMADDQRSQSAAETKMEEPILLVRVLLVRSQQSVLVVEDSSGFLEGDTVLPEIRGNLPRIPFEAKPFHPSRSVGGTDAIGSRCDSRSEYRGSPRLDRGTDGVTRL